MNAVIGFLIGAVTGYVFGFRGVLMGVAWACYGLLFAYQHDRDFHARHFED